RAKALCKLIDRHFQLTSAGGAAEKLELHEIAAFNQVVCNHADQAERTRMVNMVEQTNADRVECLGNIGRLVEPMLSGYDLKAGGLELYADAEGDIVLSSQAPTDRLCRHVQVAFDVRLLAHIPVERVLGRDALR